jgi:hypothetical protein
MRKITSVLGIAIIGVFTLACEPSTPGVDKSISYDRVPPGQRATANIDGRHFDINVFRDDVMLNHDAHGTTLQRRDRTSTEINEALKTTDKDRAEFR